MKLPCRRRRRSFERFTIVLSFIIIIQSSCALTPFLTTIPSNNNSNLRFNRQGQPRLCSLVGGTLNLLARTALCFPSSVEKLDIQVQAESNRAVLQGKFQDISITVEKSKSKLLHLDKLNVKASQLNLGWSPILVLTTALPTLFWMLQRPLLLIRVVFLYLLWKMYGDILAQYIQTQTSLASFYGTYVKPRLQKWQPNLAKLKKIVLPKPCTLNYSAVVTNNNLQDGVILKKITQSVLESLMKNSVLQVAAAAGDIVLKQQQQQNPNNNKFNPNPNTNNNISSSRGKIVQQFSSSSSAGLDESQKANAFQLTQLLSATSFEIRESPLFLEDGKWMLPSSAILPGDENSRLDFCIRTTILAKNPTNFPWSSDSSMEATANSHGIGFESPECRFNVDDAGAAIPKVLGKFLPKVLWIPVGPGLLLPLRESHRVQKVLVSRGQCRLEGEIHLWDSTKGKKKQETKSFLSTFFRTPNTSTTRGALPPGKS